MQKSIKNIFSMMALIALVLSLNTGSAFAEETDEKAKPAKTEASDEVDMSRVAVPTGKYITGGILGTAVGYGIGHGIQGRYGSKGWVFTAGEAAGTLLYFSGLGSCLTNIYGEVKDGCNRGLLATGLGVLLGFRIWEIVDVWSGARPVEQESVGAFFIPDPNSPKIGLVYTF